MSEDRKPLTCATCAFPLEPGFAAMCEEADGAYCSEHWPEVRCESRHGEGCATFVWSDADSEGFIPLDDAARDGLRQLVRREADHAAAYWTGDMWAYARSSDEDVIEQIDFEPTHYRPWEGTPRDPVTAAG